MLATLLCLCLIAPLVWSGILPPRSNDPILVHAIFRHGDRTIDQVSIYPNDPYKNVSYYPYGYGQLTNKGKLREYTLGKYLRKRYNKFLGPLYTPNILDARSTDYNRTKMSLQLVLAGLFEPTTISERWNPVLNWQPIPYNYWPMSVDKVLFSFFACPNYLKSYAEYLQSPEVQQIISENRELLDYLAEHSGWSMSTIFDVYNLYFALTTELEWGLSLPEWAKSVYPEKILKLGIQEYYIRTGTLELRQIAAGYLLQKIVEDTKSKINGSLNPIDRKLFLYSGHELNIANFLATLDLFDPHVPSYGSCVMVEVHKIKNVYGIKIYYENNGGLKPQLLKLKQCDEFCPFDQFVSLVEKYFPTEDQCGNGCFS